MLSRILKLITSPINAPKPQVTAFARTSSRHLSMQTFYPAQNADSDILAKQAQALKAQDRFKNARIEPCSLNVEFRLVGFVKHHQSLFDGIFMHPAGITSSVEWPDLVQQAEDKQNNLATFIVKTPCRGLKIYTNDSGMPLYLLNKNAIQSIACLTEFTSSTAKNLDTTDQSIDLENNEEKSLKM